MNSVFIDTNILVDYFDSSRKEHIPAFVLISKSGNNYQVSCSLKSVLDLHYILGENKKAKKCVQLLMDTLPILEVKSEHLHSALKLEDWKDLEDSVQYEIAKENKSDYIITNDKKGFKNSKIPIKSAREMIEILAG